MSTNANKASNMHIAHAAGTTIGPLHVRRSLFIDAPPANVWREFANLQRIKAWLDRGHTLHALEPVPGADADLSVTVDGEDRHFGGTVLTVLPQQELTFAINWAPPHQGPVPMFWTFRLSPVYDGTLVELFHHGFERLGASAADALQDYEWGWDIKHLDALRAIVEGKR